MNYFHKDSSNQDKVKVYSTLFLMLIISLLIIGFNNYYVESHLLNSIF